VRTLLPHDTAEAIEFFTKMYPEGPFHLVAMEPDEKPVAKTFELSEVDEMAAWIDDRQGKANIYFHVNRLRPGIKHVKAKKPDVTGVPYFHVDVDDLSALGRLQRFAPPPTVIIASGGGFQAFWRLNEPLTDIDEAERYNSALAKRLGGDNCHNADRIMRAPGTINLPNAKKRAAGRHPVVAHLVDADWSRVYPISAFSTDDPSPAAPKGAIATVGPILPLGLDALPPSVGGDVRQLLQLGDDPSRPLGSAAPRYPSRSEAVFRAACVLAQAGCTDERIAGFLINPELRISDSVLEKRYPAKYAFKQARSARRAVENSWPDINKSGGPRASMRNAALALRRLGISLGFDLFRHRKMMSGQLLEEHEGEISDNAVIYLRGLTINEFDFDPHSRNVSDAIASLCLEHAFHPIREMLDRLTWDGVSRIDRWLARYLGADDTPLNAEISRIMLIAGVRRVRQPGVKFDQIVVLEGPQGTGKSTCLQILAGKENHSDQEILTLSAKEQMEILEGVWIQELGEVEGLNRAEVNKIKAFASRTTDRSRMAFQHYSAARPRQAIFVGTTNESKYLRDQTGNRRFWPVETRKIDLEALARDRDQLWAEAATREAAGESIFLLEKFWDVAAAEQAARLEDDPWLEKLSLERGKAAGDVVQVSTAELLSTVIGLPVERQNQAHTKRLAILMRKLGWTQTKFRLGGQIVRGYVRPKPPDHRDKAEF
jgi:energy-coupling factor transporter ATP-binding protein EcfA2